MELYNDLPTLKIPKLLEEAGFGYIAIEISPRGVFNDADKDSRILPIDVYIHA